MTTILLVEADPLQASLLLSLLRRRFIDVRRARDASEALCLIEQPEFAEKLGLVISAHNNLGIDGRAFVAELHDRLPQLPVLVLGTAGETSGDYDDERVAFRSRPVTPKALLALTDLLLSQGKNVAV